MYGLYAYLYTLGDDNINILSSSADWHLSRPRFSASGRNMFTQVCNMLPEMTPWKMILSIYLYNECIVNQPVQGDWEKSNRFCG